MVMPRTAKLPNSLTVPDIDRIQNIEGVKAFLKQLTADMKRNHILARNDVLLQLKDGVSGWFDDGTNFRITVVDGVITAIGDSVLGGHS